MTGRLKFSKMHGLGNDFVVIDNTQQRYPELTLAQRQWIADRHRGIGC
ncbi:MAG TPA: diaminopimelate epimerase, partial [Gammaproteobacteria bacterium]|nr:diaminopimelate epimerase [Gammaproteobacteria bacterium]